MPADWLKHFNHSFFNIPVALGFSFILMSCVTTQANQESDLSAQISHYMLAEIALLRSQNEQAYQHIDELTSSTGMNSDLYQKLVSLVKASKHNQYRRQLVSQWQSQFPDNREANLALSRETICSRSDASLTQLNKLVKWTQDTTVIENLISCLNPQEKITLLSDVLERDKNLKPLDIVLCNALFETNQNTKALLCYESSKPIKQPEDLEKLAQLYHDNSQTDKAKLIYQKLLQDNPNNAAIKYHLAGIYYDEGHYRDSIQLLGELIEKSPKNRNYQYLLASSYFATKQLEQSQHWFEKILVSKQFRNRAFYYLGLIALEKGDFESAKVNLGAVEASDEYLTAQLNYWRIISNEDLEQSLDGLYDLLNELPQHRMTIILTQIDILNRAQETTRATQKLVSLADDYPTHLRLQILRLQWLIDKNYLSHVNANLMASLAGLTDSSDQIQLITSLIYHLMEQQYGEQALAILKQQTVIDSQSDEYKLLEGLSHAIAGNFRESVALLSQLLQMYPDRPDLKNALGYTLTLEATNLEWAEQLISEALKDTPDNASYLDSLGWLKYKQGQYELAEQLLLKANQLQSDPVIKSHLIQVFMAQNKMNQALTTLSHALDRYPDSTVLKQLQEKHFTSTNGDDYAQ